MIEDNYLIPYREGFKWGFSNKEMEIVIPCKYDLVERFKNGVAKVYEGNSFTDYQNFYVGLIEPNGSIILENRYKRILDFCDKESVLVIEEPDNPIYFDPDGHQMIELPFVFSKENGVFDIFSYKDFGFKEDFCSIEGYIFDDLYDDNVEDRQSVKYDQVLRISEKCALGYFSDQVSEFYNETSEFDLINLSGEKVELEELREENPILISSALYSISNPKFQIKINGKSGYVNSSGKIIIPFVYDSLSPFLNEVASVSIGGKFAFVNVEGKILNHFIYESLHFDEELNHWIGFKGGFTELISVSNNDIIVLESFEGKFEFYSNLDFLEVIKEIKNEVCFFGLKNRSGVVFPTVLKEFPEICISNCVVNFNGKYGIVNSKGEFVVSNKYDSIDHLKNNFFVLNKDEEFFITKINLNEDVEKLKIDFSEVKFQSVYDLFFKYDDSLDLILIKYSGGYNQVVGYVDFNGKNFFKGGSFERYEEYYDERDWEGESDNPWDDVFGPGEEADDAYWNTH